MNKLSVKNDTPFILLVEDDSNDILLIKRAFRKAQLEISLEIVEDGEQAIDYLSKINSELDLENCQTPRLILLDLKLPRCSGLEVLRWLRQQPKLNRMIVVILTASQEHFDVNQAYDLGVNSYLVKPIKFEDLVNMMNVINTYWINLNEKAVIFNNWNN